MLKVALLDLGMGNLRSVARALDRAAAEASAACAVELTSRPDVIAASDKVVVPGQGAFRDCAKALAGELGDALRRHITRGAPYLGICLGLQALFEESEEAPGERGLGVFPGVVKRLEGGPGVKIPHMGWNEIEVNEPKGYFLPVASERPYFYFVHSYHAVPLDPSMIAATACHGSNRITAAVVRDNVVATQFHPEKSQKNGIELLAKFLKR